MIGLTGWLEIIKAVLSFPDAMLRLARVFQKTPQEQHEAIVARNEQEALSFEKTGRPS